MRTQNVCAVLAALCASAPAVQAQVENPDQSELRRRALGDSVVLGNCLYLEGGEISQNGDSSSNNGRFSRPFNLTLSLPLHRSWGVKDAEFIEIDRGNKPNNKFNSLWANEGNNRLFQWDGEGSWGDSQGAKGRQVWVMDADGDGGGKWSALDNDDFENQTAYAQINRNAQSAAVVCDGTTYSIGGFESPLTDSRVKDNGNGNAPTRDMYTFDLETRTWNISSTNDLSSPDGVFIRGKAACVTGFGDSPLVVTSGGALSSRSTTRNGVRTLDVKNITLYDVKSNQWLWQEATGDPPSGGRQQHCMVGIRSPYGSYEIFVYGGYNENNDILDDMWILTIPGFHWIRVNSSQRPRVYQSCVVAGNRQMVVVGGLSGFSGEASAWAEKDEWPNGLGVFDLTALRWLDGYDADAGNYTSPDSVREWYNKGGLDDVKWSSSAVERIFGSAKVEVDSASDPKGSSGTEESGRHKVIGDPDEDSDEPKGSPAGAIAGGIVGGFVAFALVSVAFFCIRRRRMQVPPDETRSMPAEVEGSPPTDTSLRPSYSTLRPPPNDTEPFNVSPTTNATAYTGTGTGTGTGAEASIPLNGRSGPFEMPAQNGMVAELETTDIPGFKRQPA